MQLRSKLFSLVALALVSANASAASLTYTLDLSVDNTWKVLAAVSAGDNFGLASYSFKLIGNTITADNASPRTTAPSSGSGDPAGFTLLRSADNTNAAVEANIQVNGSQDTTLVPNAHLVYGYGQTASSFAANGITPGGAIEQATWGAPLLLAQGTYTRASGTLAFDTASAQTFVNVFTSANNPNDEINPTVGTIGNADETFVVIPFQTAPTNTAPIVTDFVVNGYNANLPGEPQTLTHQFVAVDPEVPATQALTWSNLSLLSYTPNYGGVAPGPHLPASLSAGGLFSWVSEGSPRGDYVWQVRATDNGTPNLFDNGTITVHVTGVPEPTTLALCGLAAIGAMGFIRRRNG